MKDLCSIADFLFIDFLGGTWYNGESDHNAAFCDEEVRFGTVIQEAMKSKPGYWVRCY